MSLSKPKIDYNFNFDEILQLLWHLLSNFLRQNSLKNEWLFSWFMVSMATALFVHKRIIVADRRTRRTRSERANRSRQMTPEWVSSLERRREEQRTSYRVVHKRRRQMGGGSALCKHCQLLKNCRHGGVEVSKIRKNCRLRLWMPPTKV